MGSLIQELKRRNVFRVALAYVAITWLIIQVADIVFENFGTPAWVMKTLMFLLAIGFPLAILFAWAYEMTPEGIKRERDVDRSQSITQQTGQKLNRTIIVVLLFAVGALLVDKFLIEAPAPVTTTADKSVAVLPFVAMSRGEDDEFFADGLTEEILNSLTRVPELLVTARTSAFHFKGQDIPIPAIAKSLGVAHVVEGSVRRSGDRLRVTAQLIRAADGFHLWSENYDRDTEDTFGVQTDIAEEIATALGVYLDEDAVAAMTAAGLRHAEAYVLYQKARKLYEDAHNTYDILPGLREANTLLTRVIELEPQYSQAYVLHSDLFAHQLRDFYVQLTDEERVEAESSMMANLDAAVRNAATEEERLAASWDRAVLSGNWQPLSSILEAYVKIADCPSVIWMNNATQEFGRAAEILELSRKQIDCDPQGPFGYWDASQAALWLGDVAAAIEYGERGMSVAPHTNTIGALLRAYVAAGQLEKGRSFVDQRFTDRADEVDGRLVLAAAANDEEQVAILLTEMRRLRGDRLEVQLAHFARIGDREEANRIAGEIDARPYGHTTLMTVPTDCSCGAPWDLEATPNYAALLEQAGYSWPPSSPVDWPMKDW
jgi:TolB-like protein